MYGRGGNDTLIGGKGDDLLMGGAGTDTAVFSGLENNYSWSQNSDGSWTIMDLRSGGTDGTDTLLSIENLQFGNISISLIAGSTSTASSSASRSLFVNNGGQSAFPDEPDAIPLPVLLTDGQPYTLHNAYPRPERARLMTTARDHLSKADTVTIAAIEAGVPALVDARGIGDDGRSGVSGWGGL